MMFAVEPGGKPQEIFSSLGNMHVHDVAPDGAVLLTHETLRRCIIAHIDGTERDLSWFDWSFPMRLSADGRTLLFEEEGTASGGRFTCYIRDTDGGPAVRLEEARGRDLSADGTRVLAFTNTAPEKLITVPTGVGEVQEIPVSGVDHFLAARFLPGEKEVLLIGSRSGEESALWRVNATGGEAQPLSRESLGSSRFSFAVSPDGEWVAAMGRKQVPLLYSIRGEGTREVKGGEVGDLPVHWLEDHLLVSRRQEKQSVIIDIDLQSGARTVVRTVAPSDPAGVHGVFPIHFARDRDTFVFGYRLILSSLFVATGIR